MVLKFVIEVITSLAITNALVNEYVFEKLRNFFIKYFPYGGINSILSCTTCCGFYVGALIGLLVGNCLPNDIHIIFWVLIMGLCSSYANNVWEYIKIFLLKNNI